MTTLVDLLTGGGMIRLFGTSLLGFAVGVVVGFLYRTVTNDRIPLQVPVIAALGVVGLWLNTSNVLVRFVEQTTGGQLPIMENTTVNVLALIGGGVASVGGAYAGDRLGPNVLALVGRQTLDTEVSNFVRTVGRFITVTVPKEIEDLEGYEPIDEETKTEIAGRELVFPRGLTVDQLHERLISRLKEDYGIGHVDLELTEDATVEYLAVGSRAAGIGSTLPPGNVAVAVDANPVFNASPGDRVSLWKRGDDVSERLLVGELRATSDDVVTLIVDTNRRSKIDQTQKYDLVTLPSRKRAENEFAALLRSANATMASIEISPGSEVAGLPIGSLRPTLIAIQGPDGQVETLPEHNRLLKAGETIYVVARHDKIRKLEQAAGWLNTSAGD